MENNHQAIYNFFLKGANGKGVLLIHGITGTPSEMRYYAKSLNRAGYSVYCNTLPRHCGTLSELKKVTWPSRKETIASTSVVLITVIMVSFFLGIVDLGLSRLVRIFLD